MMSFSHSLLKYFVYSSGSTFVRSLASGPSSHT
jgi:hypothetical protein